MLVDWVVRKVVQLRGLKLFTGPAESDVPAWLLDHAMKLCTGSNVHVLSVRIYCLCPASTGRTGRRGSCPGGGPVKQALAIVQGGNKVLHGRL